MPMEISESGRRHAITSSHLMLICMCGSRNGNNVSFLSLIGGAMLRPLSPVWINECNQTLATVGNGASDAAALSS